MSPRLHRLLTSAVRLIMLPLSNLNPNYDSWSKEALVAKVKELESKIADSAPVRTSHNALKTTKITSKEFDHSAHPRRKIALKFCYAGWDYNGLTFQNDKTPLPTVEETIFNALTKARLIDPKAGAQGCEWERCGRTDSGVSAAGQVISLWVRSNLKRDDPVTRELTTSMPKIFLDDVQHEEVTHENKVLEDLPFIVDSDPVEGFKQHDITLPANKISRAPEEIRYVSVLNRLLPSTIRIIAWSPVSPAFSSRFSCKHRHYKYFFSHESLDIHAMQEAARRLVGEYDFRNFCKLDPSKQLTSFRRKILHATISPAKENASASNDTSESSADLYVFDLIGTAFLWHQVRHIMAILFLVGCRLEEPSVVTALLNTDANVPLSSDGEEPPIVSCKPEYQMADALPLMLWECAYADEDVSWRTDGSTTSVDAEEMLLQEQSSQMHSSDGNIYAQLHSIHSRATIHATLDAYFLKAASKHHSPPPSPLPILLASGRDQGVISTLAEVATSHPHLMVPIGGGLYRRYLTHNYVPLLQRKRAMPIEVANQRWLSGKGAKKQVKVTQETNDEIE